LDNAPVKIGDQDGQIYRRRLEARLRPERMRATLAFAGLYQVTHELIKTAVIHDVREFYWRGVNDGAVVYDEHAYAKQVLSRAQKDKFRASLLWLIDGGAITMAQADRLEEIWLSRHRCGSRSCLGGAKALQCSGTRRHGLRL
jgi:hypothetical protein